MSASIIRLAGLQAYDLIYPDYLAMLPGDQQEIMHRSMANSSRVWIGSDDDKILGVWGLIPPTILSDQAYLWLFTTAHMQEHVFTFIRHSQRAVAEMLEQFPLIVGHGIVGADRSLRWLKWLGAEFGEPQGTALPFQIKAK